MTQALSLITVTQPQAWQTTPRRFAGEWQGNASGANICVIANMIEEVGVSLHKHPYAETFGGYRLSIPFKSH